MRQSLQQSVMNIPSAMKPAICFNMFLKSLFSFNRFRTKSSVSSTRSSLSPDSISTLASRSRIYVLADPQLDPFISWPYCQHTYCCFLNLNSR